MVKTYVRKYTTQNYRNAPRAKRSVVWKTPKEEFALLVAKAGTLGEILSSFGLDNKGGNHKTLLRRIQEEQIDISHIRLGLDSNKGKRYKVTYSNLEDILCVNSTFSRSSLKRLIKTQKLIEYSCNICSNTGVWNNSSLTLQLDHINGVNTDNRLTNLRYLCPNCHTQTITYAGRNLKKVTQTTKYALIEQRIILGTAQLAKAKTVKNKIRSKNKIDWPTPKKLKTLVWQQPVTTVATSLGVSDVAVTRHCEKYGIQTPPRGYWAKMRAIKKYSGVE